MYIVYEFYNHWNYGDMDIAQRPRTGKTDVLFHHTLHSIPLN